MGYYTTPRVRPVAVAAIVCGFAWATVLGQSVETQVAPPKAEDSASDTAMVQPVEDASATDSSTAQSGQAVQAAPAQDTAGPEEAVIVEEEDIFMELGKQGIRMDAGEASLIEDAPVGEAAPAADSSSGTTDSAAIAEGEGPAAVEGEGTTAEQDSAKGPPRRDPSRYGGKYGPRSAEKPLGAPGETAPEAEADTVAVPAGPARVDSVESVDFARNLEDYRSPRLAMLLSALVPGLGQAYARTYWKTAVFGVIEVGAIAAGIALNVKGDNIVDDAHQYARDHYDGNRFVEYYNRLYEYFEQITDGDSLYTAQDLMNDIYYERIGLEDTVLFIEDFVNTYYPNHTEEFYDFIQSNSSVQGWDDCGPAFEVLFGASPTDTFDVGDKRFVLHPDSTYLVREVGDTTLLYYGWSENQIHYGDKLTKASSYHRSRNNVLLLLVLNHLVSAIDAGITAKRYNDKLLGKKRSVWNRISVEQRFVNTGRDVVPGYSLCITF